VIELGVNQGKGAAIRAGMLSASGRLLFFTDADLAFSPDTIEPFYDALLSGADVVIAQRKKDTRYENLGRRLVAVSSRALVGNLILPGIRDTQAGFKAFTRPAGRFLFSRQRIKRFLFDLEILMVARKKGFNIQKVYVDWENVPGSTVRLFLDTTRAARDLIRILFFVICGMYNLEGPEVLD
jgi:dolichyl-phosphate beta-glucosyltransferase